MTIYSNLFQYNPICSKIQIKKMIFPVFFYENTENPQLDRNNYRKIAVVQGGAKKKRGIKQ